MRWILAATFLALSACAPEADVLESDVSQAQHGDIVTNTTLSIKTKARRCDADPKPYGCPGGKDFASTGSGTPTVHPGTWMELRTDSGSVYLMANDRGGIEISMDGGKTTDGTIEGADKFQEFTVVEFEDGGLVLSGFDEAGDEINIGSLGAYAAQER